ncbi:hypothetical protein ERX27_02425 [Macrococcus brunensis]|uniref:Uncharacterized protein n=1 Tax=Macrococcus brunensis TaxID=198483 RepID=A0A4R6BFQ0_9STAP|nr:hypothetical protein [Macrococcus brunensis]TDL98652.1 hypothetical protein ERX27_02425 [Macrococcus brunensis]
MTVIAGVDFLNTSLSPFVQVEDENRIRFSIDDLSLKEFKLLLLALNRNLSTMAFSKRKVGWGKVKPYYLYRFMRIPSWSVHSCAIDRLYFAVVRNLRQRDIEQFYKAYRRKVHMPLVTYFYNEDTFIRISPFYVDIISDDVTLIAHLRSSFSNRVTDFDGVLPISEEEW